MYVINTITTESVSHNYLVWNGYNNHWQAINRHQLVSLTHGLVWVKNVITNGQKMGAGSGDWTAGDGQEITDAHQGDNITEDVAHQRSIFSSSRWFMINDRLLGNLNIYYS